MCGPITRSMHGWVRGSMGINRCEGRCVGGCVDLVVG